MNVKEQEYINNRHEEQESQFIGTATSISAEEIYCQLPTKFAVIPVICIQQNKRIIRNTKPISIKEYVEEEIFFVENENLAICGTGENKQAAIKDFLTHLLYFYEYYKTIDENKLVGEAIRLKNLYKESFIEEIHADR